jgi:hypothetical protein
VVWYDLFLGPLLLPLDTIWSENMAAAFRGELSNVRPLGYANSEVVLEDESDSMSPLEVGLLLLSSSSTLGSIVSRDKSSQPLSVLNCASASRFCSFRAICCLGLESSSLLVGWKGVQRGITLLNSALFNTAPTTSSGCFFHGEVISRISGYFRIDRADRIKNITQKYLTNKKLEKVEEVSAPKVKLECSLGPAFFFLNRILLFLSGSKLM